MGSLCQGPEMPKHLEVDHLPDLIPKDPIYSMYRGLTTRYRDLNVIIQDQNKYIFILNIEGHRELKVSLTVLNEAIHCVLHSNYRLKINNEMLVDPLNPAYYNTYIAVTNESQKIEYSMRVIPFKGYNSHVFKKGLEEIWIQNNLNKKDFYLKLLDSFVYGVNPDRQALVLLFEKIDNSLLYIGQYRNLATWNWTAPQKLRIVSDVLQSCLCLSQLKIIHRDIRPSNLFFIEKRKRFVVGNMESCRWMQESEDDDLLTVYGVQFLAENKLKQLIHDKQNMGIYNNQETLYNSILSIIKFIQSLNIQNQQPNYFNQTIQKTVRMLQGRQPLQAIRNNLQRQLSIQNAGLNSFLFTDDVQISQRAMKLVKLHMKEAIEQYRFQTYELLGYQKEFSDLAHQIIEKNNASGQPLKNAYILKDLGFFYESNGSTGTEYLLNSSILFCKKTERSIQYGMLSEAEEHLTQAEQLYFKLTLVDDFTLILIELKRLRALIKAFTGEKEEAKQLINKTLTQASDKNLPIEKQMQLFLAWGIVYKECGNSKEAQQRFKNGLSICDNSGAFESPLSSALFKSHFLYQLGLLHLDFIKTQHNPQLPVQQQTYFKNSEIMGRLEGELKQSLSLRQRQSSNYFQIFKCHQALASYYMMTNQFLLAKVHCKKSLVQLTLLEKKAPSDMVIQNNYDLGSICYKLKEYGDAKRYYGESIRMIENEHIDNYWGNCIKGNLGLTLIRCGEVQKGQNLLHRAKEFIKNQKGSDHYDYRFLQAESVKLYDNY